MMHFHVVTNNGVQDMTVLERNIWESLVIQSGAHFSHEYTGGV